MSANEKADLQISSLKGGVDRNLEHARSIKIADPLTIRRPERVRGPSRIGQFVRVHVRQIMDIQAALAYEGDPAGIW